VGEGLEGRGDGEGGGEEVVEGGGGGIKRDGREGVLGRRVELVFRKGEEGMFGWRCSFLYIGTAEYIGCVCVFVCVDVCVSVCVDV
jgi:hypothetical protein